MMEGGRSPRGSNLKDILWEMFGEDMELRKREMIQESTTRTMILVTRPRVQVKTEITVHAKQ